MSFIKDPEDEDEDISDYPEDEDISPRSRLRQPVVPIWARDSNELGRGAFGVVWRETDVENKSVRAVKVISKLDPRLRPEMWAREITNFTALREYPQNFVQFLESFEDDYSISIAMEYIRYGDLGKRLTSPWMETTAQTITHQLLEGLIIMHNLGITHRDLRPENIFVASLLPIVVKIGDFGVSKRVQNNDTVLRTNCGTPAYTAPEVHTVDDHGHSEYTNAVDIWSLGCVVHQILTNKVPFTTSNYWLYVHGLMEFPIQHLEAVGISEPGVEFIRSLMGKDAGSRPSAAQARKAAWLNVVEEAQETEPAVEEMQETESVSDEAQETVQAVEETQETEPVVEETQETVLVVENEGSGC